MTTFMTANKDRILFVVEGYLLAIELESDLSKIIVDFLYEELCGSYQENLLLI